MQAEPAEAIPVAWIGTHQQEQWIGFKGKTL